MKNRIIFSLDIGSSKIVSLVGSIGEQVEVCGVGNYYFTNNSKANDFLSVSNGEVCNLEDVSIKAMQVINEARINADCSMGSVILNASGNSIYNRYTKSKIELKNQSITPEIMQQLIAGAYQTTIPPQHEVLDYEVQEYLLDNENYAINPTYLSANVIESKINMFLTKTTQIDNIKKIIRNSGYSLAKLLPSGILSGMAVLNREEKELGCCLIDIGAGTTDIVVYENGFIRFLCSIPMGGENITRDITNVLKISRNLAEDIKLNYSGTSYTSNGTAKISEGILITDHRGVNTTISRKLLIDVIKERLKDIFEVTKSTLSKQKIYDIIHSGVVITGGTSLLPNIEEFAKQYFELPVRIGVPNYNGDFADLIATPKYATSLGALYFAQEYMLHEITDNKVGTNTFFNKIKSMFSPKL